MDPQRGDELPDMSLPERTTPAVAGPSPAVSPPGRPLEKLPADGFQSGVPSEGWRVGDRVLAPWEPMFLYAGSIASISGDVAQVRFDDGDCGPARLEMLRPLAVSVGQRVMSRVKMGHTFAAAIVREVDGANVLVDFDHGGNERTTVAALRIPAGLDSDIPLTRAELLDSAVDHVAAHRDFVGSLQRGQLVWAPWQAELLHVGRVDEITDDEIHIRFENGNRGWVKAIQVFPYEPQVGMRVMGDWKMGGALFPGVIGELKGDGIFIQYDDGDREWTSHKALVMPAVPNGPPVRVTKTAIRWGSMSWILWVGLIALMAVVRGGCMR